MKSNNNYVMKATSIGIKEEVLHTLSHLIIDESS